MQDVHATWLVACHRLLLRLAGSAPDDLLTQCRHRLGDGRVTEVGQLITRAVLFPGESWWATRMSSCWRSCSTWQGSMVPRCR